jgi:hypothetical protein
MAKSLLPIIAAFLIVGCGDVSSSNKANETSNNYRIIEDSRTGNIKRSVEVILEDKLEENDLKKIAEKIKRSDGRDYERTFIGYHIKQKRDSGYWATTHYNPNLQVLILGLTKTAESSLSKPEPSSSDKKVIGTWLDDWSFIGSKITIYYSKDGKLIFENIYSDGSSTTEMVESNDPRGKKLETARGNSIGEYYIINASNQLEFWGKNGNYYTAKSLD